MADLILSFFSSVVFISDSSASLVSLLCQTFYSTYCSAKVLVQSVVRKCTLINQFLDSSISSMALHLLQENSLCFWSNMVNKFSIRFKFMVATLVPSNFFNINRSWVVNHF